MSKADMSYELKRVCKEMEFHLAQDCIDFDDFKSVVRRLPNSSGHIEKLEKQIASMAHRPLSNNDLDDLDRHISDMHNEIDEFVDKHARKVFQNYLKRVAEIYGNVTSLEEPKSELKTDSEESKESNESENTKMLVDDIIAKFRQITDAFSRSLLLTTLHDIQDHRRP